MNYSLRSSAFSALACSLALSLVACGGDDNDTSDTHSSIGSSIASTSDILSSSLGTLSSSSDTQSSSSQTQTSSSDTQSSSNSTTNLLENGDAEAGLAPWFGRAQTPVVETTIVHTGENSIKATGRTNAWDGPAYPLERLVPGNTYDFSAYVRLADTASEAEAKFTLYWADSNGDNYHTLATTTLTSNEWTRLDSSLAFAPVGYVPLSYVYIETLGESTADFYIDDLVMLGELAPPPPWPGVPEPGTSTAEHTGADCMITSLPAPNELNKQADGLPDPFLSINGTRITKQSDWRCRRAEIKAQIEGYQMGRKPAPPASVNGELTDTGISVTVQDNNKTINFSADIHAPEGDGPFPAIINIGTTWTGVPTTLNNSIIDELGLATITFYNNDMGAQNGAGSRAQGKFFDLYGVDYTDSSIMAWAWGVSRLIDALETTPASKIDTKHLAVTGCSRNGKGALFAGALDERIALTIPQESGAGGTASWRVSQAMSDAGMNVQTAISAYGEQPWLATVFGQFTDELDTLPFDHHMVMGLVAPRALLAIDNPIDWLGPESTQTAGVAAKEIWKALGKDGYMSVSQSEMHDHCQFPASQDAELRAFLSRFLLDILGGATSMVKGPAVDRDTWIQWNTPTLE